MQRFWEILYFLTAPPGVQRCPSFRPRQRTTGNKKSPAVDNGGGSCYHNHRKTLRQAVSSSLVLFYAKKPSLGRVAASTFHDNRYRIGSDMKCDTHSSTPFRELWPTACASPHAPYPSLPPAAKARSLRRGSFPRRTRFAGLRRGPPRAAPMCSRPVEICQSAPPLCSPPAAGGKFFVWPTQILGILSPSCKEGSP